MTVLKEKSLGGGNCTTFVHAKVSFRSGPEVVRLAGMANGRERERGFVWANVLDESLVTLVVRRGAHSTGEN